MFLLQLFYKYIKYISNLFLANTLIDIGKDKENPSEYATVIEEQLGDFGFPDDFIFDIWGAIGDAKAGRI